MTVLWITGYPGSGKTTLGKAIHNELRKEWWSAVTIDGDDLRRGLCKDLGFSPQDRTKNILRAAEIAKIVAASGGIAICSFVSPFAEGRAAVRKLVEESTRFFEIWMSTPLGICRKRQIRGHYEKADAGEIKDFTGVSSPYEIPENPDYMVNANAYSAKSAAEYVLRDMKQKFLL